MLSQPTVSPSPETKRAVTSLLAEINDGNERAFDLLMPLIYEELHSLAEYKLRFERDDHTLTPTALVHEAYLRLVDQRSVQWQSRTHFFAVAAQAMRRILVNYAEKHNAGKRGNGVRCLSLGTMVDRHLLTSDDGAEAVLELNDALIRMESFNERGCRVVEYCFFGGLNYEEVAEVMGVSVITVRRSWTAAKAWLRRELEIS